jgi:hypothetical protein
MIRNAATTEARTEVLEAATVRAELLAPDPAALVLLQDLKRSHNRLELLVGHLDPKSVPEGVADGIHDALVALADSAQLLEAHAWGWGADL